MPNMTGVKILVVDDEPSLTEALAYNLRANGYQPLVAADADAALRLFREEKPDLVLLDVMLPSGSGFDICRLIRQSGSTIPILMLTARIAESDRVQGLELGADDYVVKPFGMRELMARIKALLRRAASGSDTGNTMQGATLASAALNLVVDIEKRETRLGDRLLQLSRKEFDLLAALTAHPGRVFDRQALLDRVWGEGNIVDDRTVDVHIRWLREKIEPEPGKPVHLLTVRGVGYKWQP
jgi:DNA-binding response OmpR family regulator